MKEVFKTASITYATSPATAGMGEGTGDVLQGECEMSRWHSLLFPSARPGKPAEQEKELGVNKC